MSDTLVLERLQNNLFLLRLPKSGIWLERRKRKEEQSIRNRIEGKFGEGKRRYSLDRQVDVSGCVRAKSKRTSDSWIATVFFIMNLATWLRKELFLSFFKLLKIVKELLINELHLVFITNCDFFRKR